MSTAKITSKGQVTLPKEVREKLHLETGGKIDFRLNEQTGIAYIVPLNKKVDDVYGMIHRTAGKKPVTIENMDRAVEKSMRKDYT